MAGLESPLVPVVDAVEVLLDSDNKPYIDSAEHRGCRNERGERVNSLAYLRGDKVQAVNEVECACGERFRIASVRPEPLSFVAIPEADWDDELEEADTVPNGIPPTRIGFRARRPAC